MTKASVFNKKDYQSDYTDKVLAESGSKFTAKVFLYMFIALAITAICTLAFAAILTNVLASGNQSSIDSLAGVVMVLIIAYIPLIIWIEIAVLRGGKGLTPAFIIYSVFMGALLSPIIALFQAFDVAGIAEYTGFTLMGAVGAAFGLTCGVFAIMALIAWTTKKNLSGLSIAAYGLLTGVGFVALLYIIVTLISGQEAALLSALVSGGFFIFVILITMVDLYNIRKIAARGEATNNLAMVCAFSLYTDFVYIFIKILGYIIRIAAVLGIRKN